MNDAKLRMLNGRETLRSSYGKPRIRFHTSCVQLVWNDGGQSIQNPRCTHVQRGLRSLLFGALFPGMDEGFGFDAEGIGDAINVIKIANYLGGIVNPTIIEAMGAQHIEVSGAHLLGSFGELLGVCAERYIGR